MSARQSAMSSHQDRCENTTVDDEETARETSKLRGLKKSVVFQKELIPLKLAILLFYGGKFDFRQDLYYLCLK